MTCLFILFAETYLYTCLVDFFTRCTRYTKCVETIYYAHKFNCSSLFLISLTLFWLVVKDTLNFFQPPERLPVWWFVHVLQKHVPRRSRCNGLHPQYGDLHCDTLYDKHCRRPGFITCVRLCAVQGCLKDQTIKNLEKYVIKDVSYAHKCVLAFDKKEWNLKETNVLYHSQRSLSSWPGLKRSPRCFSPPTVITPTLRWAA